MSRQQPPGDLIKKLPAAQAFLHLRERHLAQSNMIQQIPVVLLWIVSPRRILPRTNPLKSVLPRIVGFLIAKPCQGPTFRTR
jgi:hypothetical protein